LINQAGLSGSGTPLTLLALGSFVLLLSAGWRPMRATLLRLLPPSFSRHLPQPVASS